MLFIPAYRRAIASIAALGTLLGITVIALVPTAQAAPPTSDPGYPSSVTTATNLQLARNVARFGSRNVARVQVSSGAGQPGGTVQLSIAGMTYVLRLHGGQARQQLPRYLAPNQTYTVQANYLGRGCYAPSSALSYLTVVGRGTSTRVTGLHARNIHRGGHPVVTGRVTKSHGRAYGAVSVQLFFHGELVRSRTVRLHGGHFRAGFASVYRVGIWSASATKVNTGASASTAFRVRR
jgi:hypothetical protein